MSLPIPTACGKLDRESRSIQNVIIGVIIFNAITLGLETSTTVMRLLLVGR
jgi:hypothetical protein